jgi:hypothetical protein
VPFSLASNERTCSSWSRIRWSGPKIGIVNSVVTLFVLPRLQWYTLDLGYVNDVWKGKAVLPIPVMDEVLLGRQEAPLAMVGRNLSGKSRFELFDPTARPCTSMLGKGGRCWISPSEQGIVTLNSQIITVDECAGWFSLQ